MRSLRCTFLLVLCAVAGWSQIKSPRPFVLGEIHTLHSAILGEDRVLNIYLPEGYKPSDTVRYPVIYLLDGSADEDFIHIVGLVQFSGFDWVNKLPKSIVVGVANVDRRRDFTFPTSIAEDRKKYPTTGHSDKFIRFVERELQPFVTRAFKTNSSRTIIGESLGGLVATEILFTRPALFNTYIIVSPSLWWDNGSLLSKTPAALAADFKQPTSVYIGVGKEGVTPTAIPRVMEVDANVLADKLMAAKKTTLRVLFDYLPDKNHATIMHQAVMNAIEQLAGSKEE